jgi:hypothetical protein
MRAVPLPVQEPAEPTRRIISMFLLEAARKMKRLSTNQEVFLRNENKRKGSVQS